MGNMQAGEHGKTISPISSSCRKFTKQRKHFKNVKTVMRYSTYVGEEELNTENVETQEVFKGKN